MSLDFAKLVASGRAKSNGVCWSAEEWEAVCALTKELGMDRIVAADYVRNGIKSVEDFKKLPKEFVPQSLDEAAKESAKAMEAKGADIVKSETEVKVEPKSKKKIK